MVRASCQLRQQALCSAVPCSRALLLSAMCAADTLLGNLTVYEQLLYTSELKNSQKESLARKKERVDIVIDQLAMESCKGVRIGSALKRGISGAQSRPPFGDARPGDTEAPKPTLPLFLTGGQAKRTNIGIALVTNPRVLFLDEPTSGTVSTPAARSCWISMAHMHLYVCANECCSLQAWTATRQMRYAGKLEGQHCYACKPAPMRLLNTVAGR